MMGRTHVLLGINALWLLEFSPLSHLLDSDSSSFALCVLAATFGGLLPDLDATSSLLQNVSVGGIRPLMVPARALHHQFGHRGALHSLLALAVIGLVTIPMATLGVEIWLSLLLGFLSHLFGDACTKRGVPLLYPRHEALHLLPRVLRLSTGSAAEEVVFVLLSAAAMSLLLSHAVTIGGI